MKTFKTFIIEVSLETSFASKFKKGFKDFGLDDKEMKTILSIIKSAKNDRAVDAALVKIDKMIDGTFGTESIRGSAFFDRFWQDTIAIYLNTGDTYNTTLLYNVVSETWMITSMGDFVDMVDRGKLDKFHDGEPIRTI